jgi:hypothetical protein
MFEVGKTYETQDKDKEQWECIVVTDDYAWMKFSKHSVAYVWTHDGKSVSLSDEYDIKPKAREFWIYNGYASEIYNPSPAAIHVREVLE